MAAGQLKRKEPGSNEDLLLIRAMRDSNVPKVKGMPGIRDNLRCRLHLATAHNTHTGEGGVRVAGVPYIYTFLQIILWFI